MPVRILITDDHSILRAGLRKLLKADPGLEVVGEATQGEEAIRLVEETAPDIVLMDIGMPGMDVLEVIPRVKQLAPQTRVLMLTMHEDSVMLKEYLRAGASGYIIKRAAESELIDAIYAVHRGIIYIHPSLMASLVSPPGREDPGGPVQQETLTTRETEVLRLIVDGYTNRQIANGLSISVRTVETHRANIMEKLNLHSRVDLVRYAHEHHLIKNGIK